jgi:dTDP-D-glucose 4,6-dehydratase
MVTNPSLSNLKFSWAILKNTVDQIYGYGEPTGEYIFMKDPIKAVMRIFKVTADEVDEDEVEEEL